MAANILEIAQIVPCAGRKSLFASGRKFRLVAVQLSAQAITYDRHVARLGNSEDTARWCDQLVVQGRTCLERLRVVLLLVVEIIELSETA